MTILCSRRHIFSTIKNYKCQTYNLEQDIVLHEERIQYLEEKLANTIELSIQERTELKKEIRDLKKIVYKLKKEIKQKDKELIARENQLAEFDALAKQKSSYNEALAKQKSFYNKALAKQKSDSDAEIEKLRKEVQSQKA
ncbi:15894_t:CDS:2 [Funneliformis mosseae]|uniref:15894_t:CDS:1 n=1 Tax=Funneliformis mosseae TaxID=27381 RepID=A0A9N8YRX2_FUNMO|nr:15894_t:CDS:2 [Funneliformis mosseae]